jgi:hypothetical protein
MPTAFDVPPPSPDAVAAVVNHELVKRAIERLGARVLHVEARPVPKD